MTVFRPAAYVVAATFSIFFAALSASPAFATDVPVVGVATGDVTRGPLVDYIQAMGTLSLKVQGYDLIAPEVAARRIDQRAARPRNVDDEQVPSSVDEALEHAIELLDDSDHKDAIAVLEVALAALERDTGERVPLSGSARWIQARTLLAIAHLGRRKPSSSQKSRAVQALTPIFEIGPELQFDWDDIYPEASQTLESVLAKARRAPSELGLLSVESPASSVPVFINGLQVGETPLVDHKIAVGDYELQLGAPDSPGRIHRISITKNRREARDIDANFERELTTEGYAIVEAPADRTASPIAVQVGRGIARVMDERYGLVFAVNNRTPLLLYAALVDSQTGVVVRERTLEASPGPVDTATLRALLIYVLDGSEVDTSWPFERGMWVGGLVVTLALAGLATYFFLDAKDICERAGQDPNNPGPPPQAETAMTAGYVVTGIAVAVLGVTIYYAALDASRDDSPSLAGDWRWYAAPHITANGDVGAQIGAQITF